MEEGLDVEDAAEELESAVVDDAAEVEEAGLLGVPVGGAVAPPNSWN